MRHGGQACTIEQLGSPPGDERLHIALAGELDSASAPAVMVRVGILVGDAPDIVLDFTGITFVSASALTLIVRLSESRTELGGSLTIRGARPRDRRVFGWAQLDHLIERDGDGDVARV